MAWDLFERQRGNGHERSVRPELVQIVADEILRRVDLGPVRAVQLQLAHGAGAPSHGPLTFLPSVNPL